MQKEAAQPDGPRADPQGIAALADELHNDPVGSRVDLGQRNGLGGNPDGSFADRDVPARTGDAGLNGRDHPIRVWIDARDRTVALIEGPHRSFADREKTRIWPDWNFRGHLE